MMLDAFTVNGGCWLTDTQSQQKFIDNFMALTGKFGQISAFFGERDRGIGLSRDKAIPLHPRDGPVNSHMADGESPGQIPDTAFSLSYFQFGDGFDVVLC